MIILRTRDTHNYCRAFISGAVTACFYDLDLSRLGFEHQTFRLRDAFYDEIQMCQRTFKHIFDALCKFGDFLHVFDMYYLSFVRRFIRKLSISLFQSQIRIMILYDIICMIVDALCKVGSFFMFLILFVRRFTRKSYHYFKARYE